MKKVAATSGQSVSLATLFFAVEMVREGSWAGSDIELNFYSRPPKRSSLAPLRKSEVTIAEYRSHHRMQEKNAFERYFFHLANRTFVLLGPPLCPARSCLTHLSAPPPRAMPVFCFSLCRRRGSQAAAASGCGLHPVYLRG